MTNLLIISIIWVLILDLCGFSLTVDKVLYRIIYKNRPFRPDAHFPPFDCSLCMTFWTGLIYLLITHSFTLYYLMLLLLFAWLTTITKDILTFIRDFIIKMLDTFYKIFIE